MCGIVLEKGGGPAELAWHLCDPTARPHTEALAEPLCGLDIIQQLIEKETLTTADAAGGLLRASLMDARDGKLSGRDIGDILAGMGKLGGSDGAIDADALMQKWLEIGVAE